MEKSRRDIISRDAERLFQADRVKLPLRKFCTGCGISTAFPRFFARHSFGVEPPDIVGAETDRNCLVEMFVDDEAAICQAAAKALFIDLQNHILELHRIIATRDSLTLDRKDAVEIPVVTLYKGCAFFA